MGGKLKTSWKKKKKGEKEGRRDGGREGKKEGEKPISISNISCLENSITGDGFLSNHP